MPVEIPHLCFKRLWMRDKYEYRYKIVRFYASISLFIHYNFIAFFVVRYSTCHWCSSTHFMYSLEFLFCHRYKYVVANRLENSMSSKSVFNGWLISKFQSVKTTVHRQQRIAIVWLTNTINEKAQHYRLILSTFHILNNIFLNECIRVISASELHAWVQKKKLTTRLW